MRSLSEITRDLFTRYSERKLGRKSNWSRLSADRQADWLEDSYMVINELLTQLEKELDLKLPDRKPQASYETGVLHGMKREQTKIQTRIRDLREKYLSELQDFINKFGE